MRNFPSHFWQLFQEKKDDDSFIVVDDQGESFTETYWEWTRRVQRIAVSFLESGLKAGERVGLIAPNSGHWFDVAFGAWLAGGVLVPISSDADRQTTLHCLGRSGSNWIVVRDASAYHRIRGQGASLPEGLHWLLVDWDGETSPGDATTLTQFEEEGRSLVARGRVDDLAERIYELDPTRPSLILYEEPPGDDPHGAFYTGDRLAEMLENLGASLPFGADTRLAIQGSLSNPRSFLLGVAALMEGHVLTVGESGGALTAHLDTVQPTHLVCDADYLLRKTKRWRRRIEDAPEFLQGQEDEENGGGFKLTGMLESLGEQAAERLFYRPLRQAFGGTLEAMLVLGPMLPEDVEDVLESSDTSVLDVYGHPECGISHLEQPGSQKPGAVGRTVQGYSCRIADDAESGEILIRSDFLFDDYWDETGPREIVDGWLHTSDTGHIRDGILFVD